MGMCKPSGGKIDVYGPYRHSLPKDGKPNTRVDYYDILTGRLLQQRWYDANGLAVWDRDWDHNDHYNTHTFPHDHYWDWSKKKDQRMEFKGPNGEKTNSDYC